jgi:hypothetical protein
VSAIALAVSGRAFRLADTINNENRKKLKDDKVTMEHNRKLELLAAETARNESARKLVEDYVP